MHIHLPKEITPKQVGSLVLSLTCLLTILALAGLSLYHYQHPAISLVYASQPPLNAAEMPRPYGVDFDETVIQKDGYAKLSWANTNVLITSPADVKFTTETITLTQGTLYIQSSETIYLNIGDESFTLTNAEIIVDLTTGQILVLSGKVTTPSAETATTGQVIDLSGSNTVSSLNRELLTSEPTIAYLLVALSEHQDIPASLADTTAPELISLSPENGITSTDDKAFISGKTEAGATVLINSSPATVDQNGDFGLEVPLQMGENNLEILVTDPAGNAYHTQLTITRQAPVATSSCSRPAIADQIISAINSYRAASGLGQLVPTASLNNAAQGHSCWMQSAGTLNHIGSGGSTFNGRCAAAGGACDAENIAWAVGFSAQGIVDLWKASAGHNQNMLGSHTQIGVGYAGGYATAVFY